MLLPCASCISTVAGFGPLATTDVATSSKMVVKNTAFHKDIFPGWRFSTSVCMVNSSISFTGTNKYRRIVTNLAVDERYHLRPEARNYLKFLEHPCLLKSNQTE
jgi:hypothetical protein